MATLTPDERRASNQLYEDCAAALKRLPKSSAGFDQNTVVWCGLGATVAWMLEGYEPEDRLTALEVFMRTTKDLVERGIHNGR